MSSLYVCLFRHGGRSVRYLSVCSGIEAASAAWTQRPGNNTLIRDSGRRRATLGGDMAVVWEAV